MLDDYGGSISSVPTLSLSPTGSEFKSRSNEALGWTRRSLPPFPTEKRDSTKAEKRKSRQRETLDNISSVLDFGGKSSMVDDKKVHDQNQKDSKRNTSEIGSGVVSELDKPSSRNGP